jgi:hypothetical protein
MSKAVLIIGVLGAALCMCCILIALGVFAMSDGPAPAPSPSASGSSGSSGSSRSSGSGSSGSGSSGSSGSSSDDSDDEPEASEARGSSGSSVEEEDERHPLTDNGRCGPGSDGRGQRCKGKACCSQWNWCGGERGTSSDWCHGSDDVTGPIGHWGGEYDGTG